MSERIKVKAVLPKKETLKRQVYYVVDLDNIISNELHELIFDDPLKLKLERVIDLIETDKPNVTEYNNISKDIRVIILVPDDIYFSEFKMFKLRLILNELPIKYHKIFNEPMLNTFKNEIFCETVEYKLEDK